MRKHRKTGEIPAQDRYCDKHARMDKDTAYFKSGLFSGWMYRTPRIQEVQ